MAEGTGLMLITGWLATLTHACFAIAFLVIGATVVRRKHEAAGWLVVLSGGISLLSTCLAPLQQVLSSAGADADATMQRSAMFTLLRVLLTIGSSGALLAALVQLVTRTPGTGIRGD